MHPTPARAHARFRVHTRRRRNWIRAGLTAVAASLLAVPIPFGAAAAAPAAITQTGAQVNGTGSSYVGLAMQQWTSEGSALGLKVNYTPTGSPDGLSRFAGGQVDFAGTEAEYSSLGVNMNVNRGYQYVPSVAGAVAVMYNVVDLAGRKVNYLHLSRSTVAKIFMGYITHWDDPAIAADNKPANLRLPKEPINVVYRSGESGTTALFYDFVREMEPGLFNEWAARNRLRTDVRIIALDSSPGFAPRTQALNGSDQIAQFVAGDAGKWSIAYDEFGYAKVYGAASAWIQNESGAWVLPYAENISAGLNGATLRPDLSQELRGVYRNQDELTYPISAYSYIVAQCETDPARNTCKGPYANPGTAVTLSGWMRYIACEGQVRMAQLGYSPLPTNLSQEVANAIGRMNGVAPEALSADNCRNPRFSGSLGAGARSPRDPYLDLVANPNTPNEEGPNGNPNSPTGNANSATGTNGTRTTGTAGPNAATGPTGDGAEAVAEAADEGIPGEVAAGRIGASADAIGGGSANRRAVEPTAYPREPGAGTALPALVLVGAFVAPVAFSSVRRRRTRP